MAKIAKITWALFLLAFFYAVTSLIGTFTLNITNWAVELPWYSFSHFSVGIIAYVILGVCIVIITAVLFEIRIRK